MLKLTSNLVANKFCLFGSGALAAILLFLGEDTGNVVLQKVGSFFLGFFLGVLIAFMQVHLAKRETDTGEGQATG